MRFENTKNGHNKFYEIKVAPGPKNIYRVLISYGPKGSELVTNKTIYEGDVEGAMKAFAKKKKDRIRHGYVEIEL